MGKLKSTDHVSEFGYWQKQFVNCLDPLLSDLQVFNFKYDKEFYAPYNDTAQIVIQQTSEHVKRELQNKFLPVNHRGLLWILLITTKFLTVLMCHIVTTLHQMTRL